MVRVGECIAMLSNSMMISSRQITEQKKVHVGKCTVAQGVMEDSVILVKRSGRIVSVLRSSPRMTSGPGVT